MLYISWLLVVDGKLQLIELAVCCVLYRKN
jgi:hypothetical protein